MEEYIISANEAGLGNRLKCLVSSMRMAEAFSKTLILFWPENPSCNCRFSDLFENKITQINQKELERLVHEQNKEKKYEIRCTWRLLVLPDDRLPSNFARVYPSENGNDIDFEYDRIPLSVRMNLLRYINRLIPQKYIKEEVEKFSRYFNDDTVSVHIRFWEKEAWEKDIRRYNFFDIRNVYKIMDNKKNNIFFVTCNSLRILEQIKNRYGKRVLCYPVRTFPGDRESKEGIQDALIELLLLAKNKYLKVSYISAYSEMAWWFGGCRAKVETIPTSPLSLKGRINIIIERIRAKGKKLSRIYLDI